MSTYVIGDVQGCFSELMQLVERIAPTRDDRLWFAGDLVNRGPASLEVLRFVYNLGSRARVVLGNHDLHLIARARVAAPARRRDTLEDILAAPDRDELVAWLQAQPLVVLDQGVVMVHAGFLPRWTLHQAADAAAFAQACLNDPELMVQCLGNSKSVSDDAQRARDYLAVLTRLRYCDQRGDMLGDFDGPPNAAPKGYIPWFAHAERCSRDVRVVFGHWAALGFYSGDNVRCLDGGCVWGGRLYALRLEDDQLFSVSSHTSLG